VPQQQPGKDIHHSSLFNKVKGMHRSGTTNTLFAILCVAAHPTGAWSLTTTTTSRFEFLQQLLLTTSTSILLVDEDDDDECRNGALVTEMAVPGAYNQACMNLPQRVLPLHVKGGAFQRGEVLVEELTIRQEASGSGKTGLAVWNSGLLLTRLLESLVLKEAPDWWNEQQDVLELGCGTGLVSIAASRLGAKSVLATDGNPEVIRLSTTNLELNNRSSGGRIQAQVMQWGLLNAMDYCDSADLVLGADLTYNSGAWRVLAETMFTVLKPSGCVLYLSLGHEGFNVNAEVDGFLSVAREVGLVPVNEIGGVPLVNLLEGVVTPSEKRQLQQSGGARVVVLRRKQLFSKN
jgi:SAM-dependent methyltransferase